MGQLRAYFDRIQGRLFAAFVMALLGTVIIWFVGQLSLGQFSREVGTQIDQVYDPLPP